MAASCKSIRNGVLELLNIEKVAVNNKKEEGKAYLAECLGWDKDKLEDDGYLRDTIKLDYCYEVIDFCSKKGFPWHQIKKILQLAEQFMEQATGVALHEAIQIYQDLAISYSGEIKPDILQAFTSYIFATYFHHFRLYQLVLTEAREEFLIEAEAEIEPPSNILPLHNAKPEHIYEYDQKLEAIEQEEKARKDELKRQKDSLLTNQPQDKVKLDSMDNTPVTRELLEQIIQEAARNQCETVEKLLQIKVEDKHEGLNFYLEKTSLPRPAELGAPPRTKQAQNHSAKSRLSTKTKASMKSTQSKTSKKGTTKK
ncbi:uncharacterized protein C8orf74 homolog [Apostichopus japonicus]|uniref:uncharacterized protein C8orf74 homolog n=1 Tax=Stichopus japonicus TaxID=307972 RepID=UPI003AB1EC7D